MTGYIVRREAGGVEAVATKEHDEAGEVLLVFESAARAEKHRNQHDPRFRVFEVAELDEMGIAGVMVEHGLSAFGFVPEDEREEVAVYGLEEPL